MGQKTNQNILRLGKTKEWESKYIEKKPNELARYTFKNLEIQKFIHKLFELNNLTVSCCKISQSGTLLHIFVSYFALPQTKQLINQPDQNIKVILKKRKSQKFVKKHNSLKKNVLKYSQYIRKSSDTNIKKNSINSQKFYNRIRESYFLEKRFKRLNTIDSYKKYINIKTYRNISHNKSNIFIKKILESIKKFAGKKVTLKLSFKQLNTDWEILNTFSKKKKNLITTNLLKLRKFQKNNFFNLGITFLYSCIISSNSSELLSKYIAFYLKLVKRHRFFLAFLKNTLKIFLNKNFSKIKRIKIVIKGRFNGAPRAKKTILSIGIPPSLTLNSNIYYSEATSFTANGTFGIKVWTYS